MPLPSFILFFIFFFEGSRLATQLYVAACAEKGDRAVRSRATDSVSSGELGLKSALFLPVLRNWWATSLPQPWFPWLKRGALGGRRGKKALSVVQAPCKLSACGNFGFHPLKIHHSSFYGSPESTFISFFPNPKVTQFPFLLGGPGPSLR